MGGGIGMGNTCRPMAVSFQCMTKSTTIKKNKKKSRDSRLCILHVCTDVPDSVRHYGLSTKELMRLNCGAGEDS